METGDQVMSDYKKGQEVKYLGNDSVIQAVRKDLATDRISYRVKYTAPNGTKTVADFVNQNTISPKNEL